MSTCIAAVSNGLRRLWSPPVSQVRFRFHKDKIDAGPLLRRFGFEEKILNRGMLPHVKHERHLPGNQYKHRDHWSEKNALFGQNDYIDILGGNMHPTKILSDVPLWMRGFKGNEFQFLLRKQQMMKHGEIPWRYPSSWRDMNKRIYYLYKFLNRRTRTWVAHTNRHCS